ncbi:hypothetical protein ACPF7I_13605 [Anoxybacillus sp. D401a]|uniref:hypothetical protein n=1 Tax=Anoxybacillus sp. D401a TaxID=575112 RepID=UPI003D3404F9
MIEICKWKNNADSPVLFFIDDLANVWVDSNGNGQLDLGEDWGYWKYSQGSSMRFLEEQLLKQFPEVKVTFFVPVGERVGMIKNPTIKSISKKINSDQESIDFFRKVHEHPNYELAYHGTTHGIVGDTAKDFIQEWESYSSLEEALERIKEGKEIFKETVGEYPKGGKYCGYKSNEFSDDSIDKSGFLWWCRYWNRGIIDDPSCDIGGNDRNPITNFDIKYFGKNNVIDIPSTVNGGLFNDILKPNYKSIKGIAKILLKPFLLKRKLSQIDYLLKNNLIISIQEHIAPSRDDGRIQTPNIFSDLDSLKYIFNYLKNKNVWYCTGTELADYVTIRDSIKINVIEENKFVLKKLKDISRVKNKEITISFNQSSKYKSVNTPLKSEIEICQGFCTIPVEEGIFHLCI